jgi:hypothetical protein
LGVERQVGHDMRELLANGGLFDIATLHPIVALIVLAAGGFVVRMLARH